MITPAQMYWLVTLDSIIGLMIALVVLGVLCFIASMAFIADTHADDKAWVPVSCIAVALLALFGVAFVPSTKQMAAIIVVPKIVNNEKVQEAGNQLYSLAVEWMDELRPTKEKTK